MLLLLSLSMLIGCYIAGSIPLAVSLSEEKLKLVTVMGAGLLVGTALAVIIPEGIQTMYSSQQARQHTTLASTAANAGVQDVAQVLHDHDHEDHEGSDFHRSIGISLVLGFTFMLLVDQLSGSSHSHGGNLPTDSDCASPAQQNRHKSTLTIGLVVHAAADGVALGAAASMSKMHVEIIVFVAIMLHKAPAAFGLATFLMHEKFDRARIRRHLMIFSAAAPILAMVTYFGLSGQNKQMLSEVNATGIAMLFSAGTFLYVSTVHVLPELANMGLTHSTSTGGTVIIHEHQGFTKCELLFLVGGTLLPLVLSLGHHHH